MPKIGSRCIEQAEGQSVGGLCGRAGELFNHEVLAMRRGNSVTRHNASKKDRDHRKIEGVELKQFHGCKEEYVTHRKDEQV